MGQFMGTVRTWRRLTACLVAAGTVIGMAAATPAQAQPLVNIGTGSFETPVLPAGTFQTFSAPATMGTWNVTEGGVDLTGAGFWQAADGQQSLDLNGNGVGAVAQRFVTGAGRIEITYELAGNPDGGPAIKTGQVLADGKLIENFAFDTTGRSHTNMGHVEEKIIINSAGLGTTLTFRSTTAGAFGPVIDEVDVGLCPGPLICH